MTVVYVVIKRFALQSGVYSYCMPRAMCGQARIRNEQNGAGRSTVLVSPMHSRPTSTVQQCDTSFIRSTYLCPYIGLLSREVSWDSFSVGRLFRTSWPIYY